MSETQDRRQVSYQWLIGTVLQQQFDSNNKRSSLALMAAGLDSSVMKGFYSCRQSQAQHPIDRGPTCSPQGRVWVWFFGVLTSTGSAAIELYLRRVIVGAQIRPKASAL